MPAEFEQSGARIIGAPSCPISTKSPLRYPGGKSRAVSAIRQYIPDEVEAICSPFFGGGSVEISCAADGIAIYGSDAFQPVVDFWQEALRHIISKKFLNLVIPCEKRDDKAEGTIYAMLTRSQIKQMRYLYVFSYALG